MTRGRIVLVGAGPGDPELLTLKAVRAIGEADVLLVDDLVDPAVLVHARPAARIVEVGKRGGCRSTPQAFIERLMIAEASEGRVVVRLKGGDPGLFGRSGEEIDRARQAGIDIEIVPGVTSALAAAADAAVSLTDRRHAAGVVFITGHERSDGGEPTPVDWRAIVETGFTIVIYMGVARAARLRQALLDAGCAGGLPALVVQSASRSSRRTLATTVDGLARDMGQARIASPAVIVIGEVARRAEGLAVAGAHPALRSADA